MISVLDWVVLLIYAGVVIAIGFFAGKKESTTEDYFLGGRKMPWFSVMIFPLIPEKTLDGSINNDTMCL